MYAIVKMSGYIILLIPGERHLYVCHQYVVLHNTVNTW